MNGRRPKVYVPQEPTRFDKIKQELIPALDLSPALAFGEIVVCLTSASANFINIAPVTQALKERMAEFRKEDYLLAVGDPTGIAVAAIIAYKATHGRFQMLKWDRISRQYQPIEVSV